MLRGLPLGAAGCISATANVNPGPIARLFHGWREADAQERQSRLDVIRGIFARLPMIPAMKAAVAHWTDEPDWRTVRPPLTLLDAAMEQELIGVLEAEAFDMPGLARAGLEGS